MNPALIAISKDITEHLEANEEEAAIAKIDLLKAEIERANCKHPQEARILTGAWDYQRTVNLLPTFMPAFRCMKCGRYVVGS